MSAIRRITVTTMVVVGLSVSALGSVAGADETSWLRGFEPSLSIALGGHTQRSDGSVDSALRGLTDDELTLVMPVVSVGGELASPKFGRWNLQVFLHAGYQFVTAGSRDIARDGNPTGNLTVPNPLFGNAGPGVVGGQGAQANVEFEHQWTAGIGVSVPIEIAGIPFYVRPSIDYFGQRVELDGSLVHVECPGGGQTGCGGGPFAPAIFIDGTSTAFLHAVGPRLAVEARVASYDGLDLRVFASGGAFVYVGGDEVSGSFQGPDGDELRASYESEPVFYQGLVGARIVFGSRD